MNKIRISVIILILFIFVCSISNSAYAEIFLVKNKNSPHIQELISLTAKRNGILSGYAITKFIDFDNLGNKPYYCISLLLSQEDGVDFYKEFDRNDIIELEFKPIFNQQTIKISLPIIDKATQDGHTIILLQGNHSLTDIICISSDLTFGFKSSKTRLSVSLDANGFAEWKQVAATVRKITER